MNDYSIHDYSGILNRINMYMFQLASSPADKTNLYKEISILQDAIDRKDDNAVDAQMTLIDAEFEKIALATNPSIAADRIKYAKEVADAKIASDAANAKITEESELDRLTKEIVKSKPGWNESKIREN